MADDVERFVKQYGEPYRRLIEDALRFLDQREPTWRLPRPINRSVFIRSLIRRAQRSE
jgi:hypothetical protein